MDYTYDKEGGQRLSESLLGHVKDVEWHREEPDVLTK